MNYFIPKGTDVFVNNFGLLRGCPEPDKFIPERFLGASHLLGTVPSNPRDVIFGFGRRRCPGWHFADRSVWVAISHIIPLFDILPVIDENGREVIPSAEFGTSNVRKAKKS
ncbi:hypothetical protein MPER_04341 [Moniliophthora perniciosa FA553]|nr:hypothetical protein MPER_04341 [Moniliophthora perniciosa FA553]